MSILNAITSGAGGVALTGDTSGNLTIQSAGTNVATFTSSGLVFNNGSALVNSPLNDYETGTWTPACYFNGVASSGQTGTFAGYYTKIGNQVFVSGLINLTNKGSGTGNFGIAGLPFAANSATNYRSMAAPIFFSGTATSYVTLVGLLSTSTTSIEILGATAATTDLGNDLTAANLNNTTAFRFAAQYTANF
jgi:hypothetical protein